MPFSKDVNDYINDAPEKFKIILTEIRNLVHESVDDVSEAIKWGFPVFSKNKDFSYLRLNKHHVTFGLHHCSKITEQPERLEGTGIDMRHVKIRNVEDIDHELFSRWLKTIVE